MVGLRLSLPRTPYVKTLVVVEKGAARVGRSARDLPNVALTSACVLQPGESATAQRVMDRVGPFAIVALHALWEQSCGHG